MEATGALRAGPEAKSVRFVVAALILRGDSC